MIENRMVNLNGDFVAWPDATVHLMSHSLARASAIFEVISLHSTANGAIIFRLTDHIERLFQSAQLIQMELPVAPEQLCERVAATARRNRIESGMIKIVAYYPQIALSILPAQRLADIAIFVVDPPTDFPDMNFTFKPTETACISKWRKTDPQAVPIQAKVAANYLNGLISKSEALERGFDKGILLDSQGFVAECATESIFIVKDGCLMTPALGTILDSITRRSVLAVAASAGIEIHESRLPPERLFDADEIFLACTPFKVQPVNLIEDHSIEPSPGPLTQKMAALLDQIIGGNENRFKDWLYPI